MKDLESQSLELQDLVDKADVSGNPVTWVKSPFTAGGKGIRSVLSVIESLNNIVENATRSAVYKTARGNGIGCTSCKPC